MQSENNKGCSSIIHIKACPLLAFRHGGLVMLLFATYE